jgi:hypothetical protein
MSSTTRIEFLRSTGDVEWRADTGRTVGRVLRHLYDTPTKKGLSLSPNPLTLLVAGAGFEPATFGL